MSVAFEIPKRAWISRINWRIAIFIAVIGAMVGVPFYIWANEVITGGIHNRGDFKEVDLKAMSTFDMDQVNGTMQDIPQRFRDLEGKKVMMVGEMWSPVSAGEDKLSYFVLVYSKTKCCFNGPPLAQHFVDGNVVPGATVYYYDTPVQAWGTMHVFVRKEAGGVIKSIYHVDIEKVEPIEN
jgi:hypothetical protein